MWHVFRFFSNPRQSFSNERPLAKIKVFQLASYNSSHLYISQLWRKSHHVAAVIYLLNTIHVYCKQSDPNKIFPVLKNAMFRLFIGNAAWLLGLTEIENDYDQIRLQNECFCIIQKSSQQGAQCMPADWVFNSFLFIYLFICLLIYFLFVFFF